MCNKAKRTLTVALVGENGGCLAMAGGGDQLVVAGLAVGRNAQGDEGARAGVDGHDVVQHDVDGLEVVVEVVGGVGGLAGPVVGHLAVAVARTVAGNIGAVGLQRYPDWLG